MSVEDVFIKAAKGLNLCELIDVNGNGRLVEPYMVYTSNRGKRLFHCYQLSGYSKSGEPQGWKNPEERSFASANVREETFTQRREYNPFNMKMFPTVHFSISTADGRQR
ncbi:MAG: hypothetical protein RX316_05850 [bacterium]|nr:hypothetical protein [bacterium]